MGTKNAKKKKTPQLPPAAEETSAKDTDVAVEEQPTLIDVAPENAKEIVRAAKRYKKAQADRIAALNIEIEEKAKLLNMIKQANLQRLADGTIRCHVDGFLITVTPRDEVLRIKDENESDAA